MIKFLFLLIIILSESLINAQDGNIFLNRDYWKTNPTIEDVKNEIEKGNSVSELDRYDFDAVSWAILESVDNSTIKEMILMEGNGADKITHDGRSYVFWAAYKNNIELMNFLISEGTDMRLIDSHGYSLSNFCAVTGQLNTEIYELCIQHGSILTEEKNNDGANALLLIIPFLQDAEMIRYFEGKGLDVSSTDNDGNNAFVYAARSGNTKMMKHFMDLGMDPKTNNSAALFFAARGMRRKPNGIDVYQYLEVLGLDLKAVNSDKDNLLHVLARRSEDSVLLEYLIEKGVGINDKNNKGETPIMKAIQSNNHISLSLLEGNKSDFYVEDLDGNNLWHHAIEHEDKEICFVLLKHDVELNVMNREGMSPLHLACMKGTDLEYISFLIDAGADLKQKTPFNELPYDLASENELLNKNLDQIKFLKPNE